ncbi:MAG: AAA family ATPase [Magnetococcus sp. DMHC-6]
MLSISGETIGNVMPVFSSIQAEATFDRLPNFAKESTTLPSWNNDHDGFFSTSRSDELVANIRAALLTNKAPTLLIGEAGTGKTRILNHLMRLLHHEEIPSTILRIPEQKTPNILELFMKCFGLFKTDATSGSRVEALELFFQARAKTENRHIILIDEAQYLSQEEIDIIIKLTHSDGNSELSSGLLFAGRPSLGSFTLSPAFLSLSGYAAGRTFYTLTWSVDEIGQFIRYLLNKTGDDAPLDVSDRVIHLLGDLSGGNPQKVENILCLGVDQVVSREFIKPKIKKEIAGFMTYWGDSARQMGPSWGTFILAAFIGAGIWQTIQPVGTEAALSANLPLSNPAFEQQVENSASSDELRSLSITDRLATTDPVPSQPSSSNKQKQPEFLSSTSVQAKEAELSRLLERQKKRPVLVEEQKSTSKTSVPFVKPSQKVDPLKMQLDTARSEAESARAKVDAAMSKILQLKLKFKNIEQNGANASPDATEQEAFLRAEMNLAFLQSKQAQQESQKKEQLLHELELRWNRTQLVVAKAELDLAQEEANKRVKPLELKKNALVAFAKDAQKEAQQSEEAFKKQFEQNVKKLEEAKNKVKQAAQELKEAQSSQNATWQDNHSGLAEMDQAKEQVTPLEEKLQTAQEVVKQMALTIQAENDQVQHKFKELKQRAEKAQQEVEAFNNQMQTQTNLAQSRVNRAKKALQTLEAQIKEDTFHVTDALKSDDASSYVNHKKIPVETASLPTKSVDTVKTNAVAATRPDTDEDMGVMVGVSAL